MLCDKYAKNKGVKRKMGILNEDMVKMKIDNLIVEASAKDNERTGVHASGVITDSGFCYRKEVMGVYFSKNKIMYAARTLRVFLEGWYIHKKYQDLFVASGIADHVEQQHKKGGKLDLFFTPDAVINMFRNKYVVEIKSMNTFQFAKLKSPPKAAVVQCIFYMHYLGLKKGIVLIEDKNTQDFKVFMVDYNYDLIEKYVKRMEKIIEFSEYFKKNNVLPKRICANKDNSYAKRCFVKDACFCSKGKRDKYLL